MIINFVGIQFGQFLVDRAEFAWTIATDSASSDMAILALPGRGDVLIYPASFVAKRWEKRETGFIAKSFQDIQQQVNAVRTGQPGTTTARPWWKLW